MKNRFIVNLLGMCTGLLAGCTSNPYQTFFSPTESGEIAPLAENAFPRLVESDGFQELETYLNRGYVEVGRSAFNGPWASRTYAVDCAREHGASVVLAVAGDEKIHNETRIVSIPVYTRTYDHGFVDGPRGYRYYSGTTTTESSVPVQQNYKRAYYNQSAIFLAKRKYQNSFGVYFKLPEKLPGKPLGKIQVEAVTPGSRAAASGLKKGDQVLKINGRPVVCEEDIRPFTRNEREIRSVEVTHE